MLKIKDNVDLKELEKFGFKYRDGLLWKSKKGEWNVIELKIDLDNRTIVIAPFHDQFNTIEDTLYDLIKADLIEKVEDK